MTRLFKVGFDIDDVLFPWYARVHQACLEAGITNDVEPTTWRPYEEYGITQEEWIAALDVVTTKGNLYLSTGPDEDAARALRSLVFDGHEIHLVTARGILGHSRLIKRHTVRWLERYGIPYKSLTFTRDKGGAARFKELDFFIDDNVQNWLDVGSTNTASYLLDRPWNQELPSAMLDEFRVRSVQEYVDIIKEEANRE
jgi:uncharacterized HAD superfamily protein